MSTLITSLFQTVSGKLSPRKLSPQSPHKDAQQVAASETIVSLEINKQQPPQQQSGVTAEQELSLFVPDALSPCARKKSGEQLEFEKLVEPRTKHHRRRKESDEMLTELQGYTLGEQDDSFAEYDHNDLLQDMVFYKKKQIIEKVAQC